MILNNWLCMWSFKWKLMSSILWWCRLFASILKNGNCFSIFHTVTYFIERNKKSANMLSNSASLSELGVVSQSSGVVRYHVKGLIVLKIDSSLGLYSFLPHPENCLIVCTKNDISLGRREQIKSGLFYFIFWLRRYHSSVGFSWNERFITLHCAINWV